MTRGQLIYSSLWCCEWWMNDIERRISIKKVYRVCYFYSLSRMKEILDKNGWGIMGHVRAFEYLCSLMKKLKFYLFTFLYLRKFEIMFEKFKKLKVYKSFLMSAHGYYEHFYPLATIFNKNLLINFHFF